MAETSGGVRAVLEVRGELISTLLIDSLYVAAAIVSRALLMRLYLWLEPWVAPDGGGLMMRILQVIIDFGIVGTTAVMVTFDLSKRVLAAWQELRRQWEEGGSTND